MVRRRRTPPEKKRLSLERDRPLAAEYPKAFRKTWPRKKAGAQRALRHGLRQSLAAGDGDIRVRRKEVRKWTGPPLGEVIAGKRQRRGALRAKPRKSVATRARRAQRRKRLKAS